eukprot:2412951-Prymnesium_polylepis.1
MSGPSPSAPSAGLAAGAPPAGLPAAARFLLEPFLLLSRGLNMPNMAAAGCRERRLLGREFLRCSGAHTTSHTV